MQSIDPKLQSGVWQRVMGASQTEAPTGPSAPTGPDATAIPATPLTPATPTVPTTPTTPAVPETPAVLSAEELLERMQHEKNDCAAYRYLCCKACGCDARTLRQMADDEACHFKKLHAMYFLITGKCVCLPPEKPDCTACLTDALRARYEGELAAAAQYEADARRWPDMADEFLCMAADETRHSKCVRAMICRRL